tara:strand:- start:1366 stop:4095 length:2730 start_codon:yes stop_codon:yes gene_type:complete
VKKIFVKLFFICLHISSLLLSQQLNSILHIPPSSAFQNQPLNIEVIFDGESTIQNAILYHRIVGQSGFQELFMEYDLVSWNAIIPPQFVNEKGLEYLIIFNLTNGSTVAYPEFNPFESPKLIQVSPFQQNISSNNNDSTLKIKSNALILSPEEGSISTSENVLIAISFFEISGVDPKNTKILLDNIDVTSQSYITTEIGTYVAPFLSPGLHTVEVQIKNKYGYDLEPTIWSFSVGNTYSTVNAIDEFKFTGKIRNDNSLNNVQNVNLKIGETTGQFIGGWEWLEFNGLIKISSQESPFLQPKNRISFSLQSNDFIKIKFGDFNPTLSPYLIQGKRVRGVETDINLGWGRLQTVIGEIERSIQGYNIKDRSHSIYDIQVDSSGLPIYFVDRKGYSFSRKYSAAKITLNLLNKFRFSLFGQKAIDDINSIENKLSSAAFTVPDWNNYISIPGIDPGVYSFYDFEKALTGKGTFNLKSKNLEGESPMDNIVSGFNLNLSLDDSKLIMETSWAISFLNRNIWDGAMSIADFDTALDDNLDNYIGRTYDDNGKVTSSGFSTKIIPDLTSIEDILIVNLYLTPLVPIDIQSIEDSKIASFMNMPSTAYNFKIRTFYYGNLFEIKYSQVGPQFNSLANPFLTKNIREFVVSDRVRFFDNKLSFGFDYKSRDNKILRSIINPSKQKSTSTNISFAPGPGMPSFTTNFQTLLRTNEKIDLDTLVYTSSSQADSIVLKDNRENSKSRNRFGSVSIPINNNFQNFNILISYNSINVEDQLKLDRDKNFLQKATDSEALSVIISSKFSDRFSSNLNFSSYKVSIPMFIDLKMQIAENFLKTIALNSSYLMYQNNLKLNAGLSVLNGSGLSNFNFLGLKSGFEFKFIRDMLFRTVFDAKIKSTESSIELNSYSLRFSINYLF